MRAFYDELADDYHLIFRDWDASMEYQASSLAAVIEAGIGVGGTADADAARRILDCSCGIGTQAIGLARVGDAEVIGTDLSPRAAARASREASARGVGLPTAAADMRALPFGDGAFDVVLSADNSVPHLLTPDALTAGLAEMRRVLRPDGLLVLTVRDYDELRAQRPASTPPQVSEHEAGRAIAFQLWHWHPDGERYDLEHFQLVPATASGGQGWDVRVRRATYWALTRKQLAEFAAAVGFRDVTWQEPSESGYYQPVLTARR
ncbi:class I SAM-dependent methyltransferase [Catenulispora sp. NL8]|uniref:Class I SAM-dependent methyltransferase n=1 Tax=Catenulispora pinistramenti TaxID=2705254 RepID=A0ABS5KYP6_9ACTN|nr:class I SAM-dependent methyltransferase [Catenulispora pinistramenti]MBS2551070.1 class I SAM-dependent methyltransferase [Catenulispora pinistramenti]